MSITTISPHLISKKRPVSPEIPAGNAEVSNKRVGVTTLGCKINSYESEIISSALQSDEWQTVSDRQSADLYVINTCTVTREADRQARQAVRRAVRQNPEAVVIVTGCYAQMNPQACADIPGVDLVLGNNQKLDVHQLLPSLLVGELPKILVGDLDQQISLPKHIISGFQAHTRAFVQIQQGCNQGCTFCIIHRARGPSRSLPPSLIKRQVQRLAINGYPEIVLCGVDLGSYGEDLGHQAIDLVALIRELLALECDADNPFRIRLSSIDPAHLSDGLFDLMTTEARICPQIHLSLQSGNTMILKRMKRRYSAELVRERIHTLRAQIPQLVLSADVMVGFPTETWQQFLDTEIMLRELDIAYPHVFSYSEREGTPAARIPIDKQVPVTERKARNARLRAVGRELETALLRRKVGQYVWLLPEKAAKQAGFTKCRGEDYVPARVATQKVLPGRWQYLRITGLENGQLIAE